LTRSSAIFDRGHRPIDDQTRTQLEAAALRRLVQHLRERTEVQNIDLMNLTGFCRNCLSRWYREAAEAQGVARSDPAARETVYGMPYVQWKATYQKDATAQQQAGFDAAHKHQRQGQGTGFVTARCFLGELLSILCNRHFAPATALLDRSARSAMRYRSQLSHRAARNSADFTLRLSSGPLPRRFHERNFGPKSKQQKAIENETFSRA
jgi:hypothetical protein